MRKGEIGELFRQPALHGGRSAEDLHHVQPAVLGPRGEHGKGGIAVVCTVGVERGEEELHGVRAAGHAEVGVLGRARADVGCEPRCQRVIVREQPRVERIEGAVHARVGRCGAAAVANCGGIASAARVVQQQRPHAGAHCGRGRIKARGVGISAEPAAKLREAAHAEKGPGLHDRVGGRLREAVVAAAARVNERREAAHALNEARGGVHVCYVGMVARERVEERRGKGEVARVECVVKGAETGQNGPIGLRSTTVTMGARGEFGAGGGLACF